VTTPRDELVQELAYVVGNERAEQLADAFAHQLAEQQRSKAGQLAILRSEDARLKAEGLRMGADLIDPTVTR